jgi:protein gp37
MGKDSAIQWTTHSYNPWHGCTKVSPGCKFCYMYRDKQKYGQDPTEVVRSADATFLKPIQWNKEAKVKFEATGEPTYVFLASWSDFFIQEADAWRPAVWDIIRTTPYLTYQILTKRTDRIPGCLPRDWGKGDWNVWMGTSIENQAAWDLRSLQMRAFRARQKFFSFEPLLEPIRLTGMARNEGWAIIGGESGNDTGDYRYRPCEEHWITGIMQQAHQLGMKVFVKQLGTDLAKRLDLGDRHGGVMHEWPEYLQVREMPVV